jgi:hypothetical protein
MNILYLKYRVKIKGEKMFSNFKIIAALVVFFGLAGTSYYFGYTRAKTAADLEYKIKVEAAEKLVAQLEKDLAKAKENVITVYVDRVKIVKEKEYVYINKSKDVPSKCELSSGWVSLHDSAAKGSEPDPTGVADASPSGIKDNKALETVINNYSTCQQNAEQLKTLQEWIRLNNKIIEEGINK